ncbi:N-acetylmuramoyl-L-alanine amidase [Alkalicoccobacillus plakortidis]|uniref:N-acetylmuramoyl-L-alanine amidase n=1 Tax=Alkalicoccobacillus plakortidis TaxID=444060 RepID=A0ABT0XM17_9BACI|nr:N-acetylmuramoyl-L-alanine amidase [Alkalicoccobacillus plakortidis]MCM2676952.1 N-acetylmuramoyl-L-alanine amidase [Alkalicoccobacillus plakortidis]
MRQKRMRISLLFVFILMSSFLISSLANAAEGTVDVSSSLNVRSEPSESSAIIGSLSAGTQISYEETGNGWASIDYNGHTGYVATEFLSSATSDGARANSVSGQTIVIDPGHGGNDPGAVANGLQEKDVVLDVGQRAAEKLRSSGANVIMTRSTDEFIELEERAAIANRAGADIFVSIHANAAAATSASGTESYHFPTSTNGQRLASSIQTELINELGTRDRGVKDANFSVLRNTAMPATLLELGFITNAAEADRMKTSSFRESAANAVHDGVQSYYGN